MARRIAVYGKGGIGKSTVSSNLTAALSDMGVKVMQIGCDPKHDSTRALMGGREQTTVLDYLKQVSPGDRSLDGIVSEGYKGCLCVEAGGPEPGIGCAGRGIITAFDLLSDLGAGAIETDLILYDVLGDVVCGGFAVPMRNGYADTVYIVTSGEYMSIYAANNILRGTSNYDPDRIGGLIFNSRGDPEEKDRVELFSEAVGVPIVATIERSQIFMDAEKAGSTVVEAFPDSPVASTFRELAECVMKGEKHTAHFLEEHDLEKLILGRERRVQASKNTPNTNRSRLAKTPYASRNFEFGAPLGGCAFSGAAATCTSIPGLTTVLHSTRNCAHFTLQLNGLSTIGYLKHNRKTIPNYLRPDVVCTDMKEDDMVFGGKEVLERTIEERIRNGARDIAVITACAPGIMGDDVEEICRNMEAEHPGTRIVLLQEDGNATGDYMQGVIDAGVGLVRRFATKRERIPYSVNLVGCKTMSATAIDDVEIVTGLLNEVGISVNCVLPGISEISRIAQAPNACVNLKLNTDTFSDKICSFLEDEYGVGTLREPVRGGMAGTRAWLTEVGRFFGIGDRVESLLGNMEDRFGRMFDNAKSLLRGKKALMISLTNDVDWIMEALDAAGVELVDGYVFYRPDYNKDLDGASPPKDFHMITYGDVPALRERIETEHPDILLTMASVNTDPSVFRARIPIGAGVDPYAGKVLIDSIARGILAPVKEGWREDLV